MKNQTNRLIQRKLIDLSGRYINDVEMLAEEIKNKQLQSFLDQHHLRIVTGGGTFSLLTDRDSEFPIEQMPSDLYELLTTPEPITKKPLVDFM
jgi:hypothetical protein